MASSGEGEAEGQGEGTLLPEHREEYERMERWMDEHQAFVHDYFARKAKRSMVDGWLIAHAISHSGLQLQADSHSSSSGSNSKPSSGANTPVRKISAQEFDKGGILKPMVSTVDGTPTFLDPASPGGSCQGKTRKSMSELKALDEKELMYELVIDICNDLDVTSLCYKILLNVCMLLNADRCSLFLVQGKGSNEKWLVSKLFDVGSDSTYEQIIQRNKEIRIPWGTGIIGYVGMTGEVVNIPDAYQDPRFNSDIDVQMRYKTRSILSMAIKDSDGQVIGVAQAINKISNIKDEPFDEHDEKVFASYLAFCGIGLKNAQLYERSQLENRRNQVLLDLARVIFEEQSNVANLIHKIMMHTQSLLQCERCQVLLVDDLSQGKNHQPKFPVEAGIFAQVFDLQASDFDNDDTYNREGPQEPRFPINIGITGYVATTGETLNIPNAYADDRFDASVDFDGFRTSAILCMPIKNANGKVIGVSQLINKLDGTTFNKNDENLFEKQKGLETEAETFYTDSIHCRVPGKEWTNSNGGRDRSTEAFSIFCGMGISNTQMYETALRAMAKQRVALEVLSYHAIAPAEEAQRLRKLAIPSSAHYRLLDYKFSDFMLDDDDTLKATIRMFMDLDLLEAYNISYEILCRWLLSVKKNYRKVTYHNWRHAFNVAQTMFCMIQKGDMGRVLTQPECLALMIGCLCHDLDHRGTNNQFQLKVNTPLAELYTTSTLEHHHFDQCIMILTTKGNDILCNVSQGEYEKILQMLESAILSTDLALYFRYRGHFFDLVRSKRADWNNDNHRDLLRSMMMTASDVSAITKPWEVQKKVAELVASEFFEQGDMERSELKIEPMAMMDREQKDKLPSMQVSFIDTICMPVYEAFRIVSPNLDPLLSGCQMNREHWLELSDAQKEMFENSPENTQKDNDENEEKS